jgi:hypothetical protein
LKYFESLRDLCAHYKFGKNRVFFTRWNLNCIFYEIHFYKRRSLILVLQKVKNEPRFDRKSFNKLHTSFSSTTAAVGVETHCEGIVRLHCHPVNKSKKLLHHFLIEFRMNKRLKICGKNSSSFFDSIFLINKNKSSYLLEMTTRLKITTAKIS